jgi:hypothetical protein
MPMRMTITTIICAIAALSVAPAMRSGLAQGAGETCASEPKSDAPQGSHWYYRMDRETRRQCWFLAPEGTKVRPAVSPIPLPSPNPNLARSSDISADQPGHATLGEPLSARPFAGATFSMRWPDVSRESRLPETAIQTAGNTEHHDEFSTGEVSDPFAISPKPDTNTGTTNSEPEITAARSSYILVFFGGIVILFIFAFHKILKFIIGLLLGRRKKYDHWNTAHRMRVRIKNHSADTGGLIAQNILTGSVRGPSAKVFPAEKEIGQLRQSSDVEETLRQLLYSWQRSAA